MAIKLRAHLPVLLGLLLAVSACSDSPTTPDSRQVRAVEASAPDGQSALVGEAVPSAPAVRVLGTRGQGLPDVLVSFAVTQGGGAVANRQVRTDAQGIATAGSWTLGSEGLNQVEARVGLLAPVRFTATGLAEVAAPPQEPPVSPPATLPGSPSSYDITLRYVNAVSSRQDQAVRAALARWRSIILTDLPDVPLSSPAGSCFPAQAQLNERVDDLLLYVDIVAIDGPGATLGESGPCYVRSESGLPLVGYVKLDAADLQRMEQTGTLDDVVLHEIGHVLGIGTLWEQGGLLKDAGTADPRYTGSRGAGAYAALGGLTADVAVENTGGSGTRDGHWRESEFGNELMTGYISGFPNPLSTLTVASLQDLGYGASAASAGTYVLGGQVSRSTVPVDLRGREHLRKPKFKVDRSGKKHSLPGH